MFAVRICCSVKFLKFQIAQQENTAVRIIGGQPHPHKKVCRSFEVPTVIQGLTDGGNFSKQ
nr:hypothetical protein Iba_scaffold37223CG0020 [Ipomoea batatas]GMC99831.1 hypothetical protein Iba_chr05eCG9450 [Ipomoea batatas]